jgi:hypothetical protein
MENRGADMRHLARVSLAMLALAAAFSSPASARQPPCTRAGSETISGTQFMAHYKRYAGRCLHLRGLIAARAYYPSVVALYTSNRRPAATYSASADIGDELWMKRAMVDLVARATTCNRIWDDASAEAEAANRRAKETGSDTETIPFIAGLCHYAGGPALEISAITWRDAKRTRLTADTDRARYGNIVPVKVTASGMNAMSTVAEKWFSDHRSDKNADLGWLPPAPLSIAYFREKNWDRRAADTILNLACVCRTADCTSKWPIHTADAWEHDRWPYYCIEIQDGDVR